MALGVSMTLFYLFIRAISYTDMGKTFFLLTYRVRIRVKNYFRYLNRYEKRLFDHIPPLSDQINIENYIYIDE